MHPIQEREDDEDTTPSDEHIHPAEIKGPITNVSCKRIEFRCELITKYVAICYFEEWFAT
jgi:hypothetical protein